jgi:hypothetical protein
LIPQPFQLKSGSPVRAIVMTIVIETVIRGFCFIVRKFTRTSE